MRFLLNYGVINKNIILTYDCTLRLYFYLCLVAKDHDTKQDSHFMSTETDIKWMEKALKLARKAEAAGEVPVGAVIVKDDELIAEGWNQPITSNDATSHAEIMAMREAGKKLNNYRLIDTVMYVTLEPCSMCVGAMIHARVSKVIYGASEPRTGALGGAFNLLEANQHNHVFDVLSGVLEEESKVMLQSFFQSRRKQ